MLKRLHQYSSLDRHLLNFNHHSCLEEHLRAYSVAIIDRHLLFFVTFQLLVIAYFILYLSYVVH